MGTDAIRMGCFLVFNMFQHKTLNKRFLYVFLEGVLETLFPDNKFDELFHKEHSRSERVKLALSRQDPTGPGMRVHRRQVRRWCPALPGNEKLSYRRAEATIKLRGCLNIGLCMSLGERRGWERECKLLSVTDVSMLCTEQRCHYMWYLSMLRFCLYICIIFIWTIGSISCSSKQHW